MVERDIERRKKRKKGGKREKGRIKIENKKREKVKGERGEMSLSAVSNYNRYSICYF